MMEEHVWRSGMNTVVVESEEQRCGGEDVTVVMGELVLLTQLLK